MVVKRLIAFSLLLILSITALTDLAVAEKTSQSSPTPPYGDAVLKKESGLQRGLPKMNKEH